MKFLVSPHFHLQNGQKQEKMVKNWIFRGYQNATELKNFGFIGKLVQWGVRKNNEIFRVAPFPPSKWPKTRKNGQKLNFWGLPKCNGAQKLWFHWKVCPIGSKEKWWNFWCRPISTFKMTKNDKKMVKIEFSGHAIMQRSSKILVSFEILFNGE